MARFPLAETTAPELPHRALAGESQGRGLSNGQRAQYAVIKTYGCFNLMNPRQQAQFRLDPVP